MTDVAQQGIWYAYAWVMRRCRRQFASLPDGVSTHLGQRKWFISDVILYLWTSLDYICGTLPGCGLLGKPFGSLWYYSSVILQTWLAGKPTAWFDDVPFVTPPFVRARHHLFNYLRATQQRRHI